MLISCSELISEEGCSDKMQRIDTIWSIGGSACLFAYLLWFTSASMAESFLGAGLFLVLATTIALVRGRTLWSRDK